MRVPQQSRLAESESDTAAARGGEMRYSEQPATITRVRLGREVPRFSGTTGMRTLPLWLVGTLLAVMTVAPGLYVVVGSVNASTFGSGFDPTTEHWSTVFSSGDDFRALGVSILLLLRVPIAMVVAFLVAWVLVRWRIPGRAAIELFLWFAFFVPILPITLGWILLADPNFGALNALLGRLGVSGFNLNVFGLYGITWVHITASTIPVVVILLRPMLAQFDLSWEEAARVCGASKLTTFRRVTVPMIIPALLVAAFAAVIKGMESFEVEQLLGVPAGIDVFSTRVYEMQSQEPPQLGHSYAYTTMLLLLLGALCFYYLRLSSRYESAPTISGRAGRYEQADRDWKAWAVSGALFLYIGVALILPFGMILMGSFQSLIGFYNGSWTVSHWQAVIDSPAFGDSVRTSASVAVLVGLGGTSLYVLIARVLFNHRHSHRRVVSVLRGLAWLPWGVPGVLLGAAYLGIFIFTPGIDSLYGTVIPFAVVLFLQGMPLGVSLVYTALLDADPSLEEAAYQAGASRVALFRRITLPLIRSTVVTVLLFTVMLTLRDIGSTVLLAAPGTQSLPLLMFSYATQGSIESASVVATFIVALSILFTLLVSRWSKSATQGAL